MGQTLATDYISFEDYLEDPAIDPHTEWVDGKVLPMHAVADRHDEVVGWLRSLLDPVIREGDLGRLFGDPFVMKTGPELPGRSPDLMFVKAENLHQLEKMCLRGPADLAIEVISGGSRTVDRLHKFAEYEHGGVGEYWLIDPERGQVTFWQRGRAGFAEAEPIGGVYVGPSLPDVRLRVEWLWQKPLPKTLPILRDWGLI